ncbi:prostaglandin E synthase-like [Watersipora subatra]|uniref:prostaglandin E synthase-like n=1 Tax=Watersipora subatra TaxID=2589382 RepID=UPI00355BAD84
MTSKATNQFQLLEQVEQSVMDTYFICAALLSLKVLLSIITVTRVRMSHKAAPNPEDAEVMKMKYDNEHEEVARCNRIVANDLENIVPFYFIGMVFCLVGSPEFNQFYAKAIFITFSLSRLLFTFAYYFKLQPFRSIFWMVSFLCNALLLGHVLYLIFPTITRYL